MTDPQQPTDTPVYDEVRAELGDLLADCPPSGPIDPKREPVLFEGDEGGQE